MQHKYILARGSDESVLTFWHSFFRQKQKWLSKNFYEGTSLFEEKAHLDTSKIFLLPTSPTGVEGCCKCAYKHA